MSYLYRPYHLKLADILGKSKPLQAMLEKANEVIRLNQILQSLLPPHYQAYCEIRRNQGELMILTVPNPAWSHKLRFLVASPDFIAAFKRRSKLGSPRFKVLVDTQRWHEEVNLKPAVPYPKPVLSQKSGGLVKALAQDLDGNPDPGTQALKNALLKLSEAAE